MDLFTVSMKSFAQERFLQFSDQFAAELERLHMGDKGVGIRLDRQALSCTVFASGSFKPQRDALAVQQAFGRVMADFVVHVLERDLIQEFICNKYRSFDKEEREQLETYCLDIIREEREALGEKQNAEKQRALAKQFRTYVAENDFLRLDGYIRFRMQDYCADLNAVIEYAVDEMLVERQYQEFISILKYFVCSQEIKRSAVHIYHCQGSEFVVLDEQFRPIDTRVADRLVVETVDREINLEDMIISTLITISPKTVYIHTKEPDMQVIRTIRMIFEERAVLCT